MGYTTDFNGSLKLSKTATPEQIAYINTFSGTRRMVRNVNRLQELFGEKHGLPEVGYGKEGEFFCMDDGNSGQSFDNDSIIEYNQPPSTQPSLWCQWVLTEDGEYLEWDGGEKFYEYVKWLEYMVENFFKRWDIQLNGKIKWQGEDMDDRGIIVVENNVITVTELE